MSSSGFSPEYLAEDSSGASFAQITALPALATLFVVLRIGVHLWRKVGFQLDGWLTLVSIVRGHLYNLVLDYADCSHL